MKFSEAWLREYVNPKIDSVQLQSQLSLAGLEVDGALAAASKFSGVIVGKVLVKTQHPDADRLSVCTVDVGAKDSVIIVCGAKNVVKDMRVAVAAVGAVLPGDFKIKRSELRGVESCGMVCSASELGLAESSEGIMPLPKNAPIGQDFRDYWQLDDACIDIDLTPNRGDCLSILGLAREVGVLNQCEITLPSIKAITANTKAQQVATVDAKDACPIYLTRVIEGIDNNSKTSWSIIEKLRRSGVRSINPVVDILNYVMLLLGQPMHAFDQAKLDGDITVRFAKDQEDIVLLNDQAVKLQANTLIIADQNKPIAIAGIMGSDASAVTEVTTTIVLESAFFAPEHIAGKARKYGLHTDASHRYERGVDPALATQAIELATELLLQHTGGKAGSVVTVDNYTQQPVIVTLRIQTVLELLGIEVSAEKIKAILIALGLKLTNETKTDLTWQVPGYRFDITLEADLIEEIARIIGYDNIPSVMPTVTPMTQSDFNDAHSAKLAAIKPLLTAQGFFEAITYSFADPKQQELFANNNALQALQNPISPDLAVMRVSLLPGLLNAAAYNLKRQQDRVRLFELGHCFINNTEPLYLSGVACGKVLPINWQADGNEANDFYQMKGIVEKLLASLGLLDQASFESCGDCKWLHPGQSAYIKIAGKKIGYIGVLHPGVQKLFKLKQAPSVFEINCELLPAVVRKSYQALSKFPQVRRDIALEMPADILAAEISATIWDAADSKLQDVKLFDIYQGDKLAADKKSMALALIFQVQDRTLQDDEIHAEVAKILKALQDTHSAQLRET